jgi:hypothetical protein
MLSFAVFAISAVEGNPADRAWRFAFPESRGRAIAAERPRKRENDRTTTAGQSLVLPNFR